MLTVAALIIFTAANGIIVETAGPNLPPKSNCDRVAVMSELTPGKVLHYTCKY